ncbi:Molybdenum-pterin-binding protein MopA [Gammaproteobacteria bacterium]|nr:Molybdenum-pterin-binding protein MopA [Gammaproteobacteria bacterium]
MPKRIKKSSLPVGEAGIEPSQPSTSGEPPPFLPRLKLSLRLMHGEEIAFGPGKADLLEAIVRTGSISAAGKSMEMSYRRAWQLVDLMNRSFKGPLVETAKGGSHGGGAWLTPLGEEVLAQYRTMDSAAKQVAKAYLGLFENMMAEPVPAPEEPPP